MFYQQLSENFPGSELDDTVSMYDTVEIKKIKLEPGMEEECKVSEKPLLTDLTPSSSYLLDSYSQGKPRLSWILLRVPNFKIINIKINNSTI